MNLGATLLFKVFMVTFLSETGTQQLGALYEKWRTKKGENAVWEGKRMPVHRC